MKENMSGELANHPLEVESEPSVELSAEVKEKLLDLSAAAEEAAESLEGKEITPEIEEKVNKLKAYLKEMSVGLGFVGGIVLAKGLASLIEYTSGTHIETNFDYIHPLKDAESMVKYGVLTAMGLAIYMRGIKKRVDDILERKK